MEFKTQWQRYSANEIYAFTPTDDEVKTVPGLSSTPMELLERVGRGLVTPDDIRSQMANHDDDPEARAFSLSNDTDIAESYEQMLRDKERLQPIIDKVKSEKQAKAQENARIAREKQHEEHLRKQAEELQRYVKTSSSQINNGENN